MRYPAFSGVVIATLALGIGACTLIFSVVNGVLLEPLPYPEPERIVRVLQVNENGRVSNNLSEPNFSDLKRQTRSFGALARYAAGVSLASARAEVSAIARRLKAEHGANTWMDDAAVVPLHDTLVSAARPALLVLFAAVLLLFVVAAANAANLVLARAIGRERELAVRSALGAGMGRLASQFFAELLVLCAAGGALGLALAAWGVDALVALAAERLPRSGAIGIDWAVLGFACGLSVATAAGLSLLAAWRASSASVSRYNARTAGGARRSPLLDGLVVAQVALALLLVVGAALLGRSFVALTSVDPGFRTEGFVFMDVSPPWPDDRAELEPLVPFYEALMERLRALRASRPWPASRSRPARARDGTARR